MSEGAKPTRRVGIHPSPPPRAIKSSITSEAAPIFLPGEDWIQAQAGPARFLSGTAPGKDRSPRGTSPPPPPPTSFPRLGGSDRAPRGSGRCRCCGRRHRGGNGGRARPLSPPRRHINGRRGRLGTAHLPASRGSGRLGSRDSNRTGTGTRGGWGWDVALSICGELGGGGVFVRGKGVVGHGQRAAGREAAF